MTLAKMTTEMVRHPTRMAGLLDPKLTMELRGGGVLLRPGGSSSCSSSPATTMGVDEALPEPAVASSSSFSSSTTGKSRKEHLTERLSRSRRSRLFGGANNNAVVEQQQQQQQPSQATTQDKSNNNQHQQNKNSLAVASPTEKRIALAKAHKKGGVVGGGGGSSSPSPKKTSPKHSNKAAVAVKAASTPEHAIKTTSFVEKRTKALAITRAKKRSSNNNKKQQPQQLDDQTPTTQDEEHEPPTSKCVNVTTPLRQQRAIVVNLKESSSPSPLTTATAPQQRPRLCLGASPRSSSASSNKVASATKKAIPFEPPNLKPVSAAVVKPPPVVPLTQSCSSLGSRASSKSSTDNSPDNTESIVLLHSSKSTESSSKDSLPKELPHPTFGSKTTAHNNNSFSNRSPSPYRNNANAANHPKMTHQLVIPVQAPPAAISHPVTFLPTASASTASSSSTSSPLLDITKSQSTDRDASQKSSTVGSDVGYLSQWKRHKAAGTTSSSSRAIDKGQGESLSEPTPTVENAQESSSTTTLKAVPTVHHWKSSTTLSKAEEVTPSSTDLAQSLVVPPVVTHDEPVVSSSSTTCPALLPSSPPRVNPWKQLSKVRVGSMSGSGSAPTPIESPALVQDKGTDSQASPPSKGDTDQNIETTPQSMYLQQLRSNRDPNNAKPLFTKSATTTKTTPSRIVKRWGQSAAEQSTSVAESVVEEAVPEKSQSSDTHGSSQSFKPTVEASSTFEDLHEEKKEDEDGYIETPVSVASMMARYGSANSKVATSTPANRSFSPSLPPSNSRGPSPATFHRATTPSPVPYGRAASPAPLYPRFGRQSPASTPSQTETQTVPAPEAPEVPQPSVPEKEHDASATIETPDKVNVSSMKARFASPTVASASREGAKSPGPSKRFHRPPQQPQTETSRSQSVGKSRDDWNQKPDFTRSSSVGRFATPTLASQQKFSSPDRSKQVVSPRRIPSSASSRMDSIETPDRVKVSNMKARFSPQSVTKASFLQPTLSSAAKRSPRKEMAPQSPSAQETRDDPVMEELRSVIETPDPVNVKSMKGMFGSNSVQRTKQNPSAGLRDLKSPFKSNSSLSPPTHNLRQVPRERSTDVATPNAPPLPARSTASSSSTPSWVRKTQEEESTVQELNGKVLSTLTMPELEPDLEIVPAVSSKEILPPLRPKSPRERPSNIPRWKQLQALDASTTHLERASPTNHASTDARLSREPSESDEMSVKQENCPPMSPRSPRDRPWNKDLESPKGWRHRFQSTLDKRGVAPKGDRESSETVQQTSSLTQMAADSVHAIDFDRALPVPELKRSSGSESHECDEHSEGYGAIPSELPPEFAASLELHLDNKPTKRDCVIQKTDHISVPVRVVDDATSDTQSTSGIVFGDPSTYGAAGGDVELTPPRVKDRARAIANWKGGLGTRPTKSNSTDVDADSHQRVLEELLASKSSSDGIDESAVTPVSQEEREPIHLVSEDDRIVMSREEDIPAFGLDDRLAMSREETKEKPFVTSSITSPSGSRRGASAVLRFWADTSQEEFDGAQEWMDCDPDLKPSTSSCRPESPSLRKKFISNAHKPRVEDINLSSLSDWKRINSPVPEIRSSPARNGDFPHDPFALETLAGLYEEPIKGVQVIRQDEPSTTFDPFFDSGEGAFDSNVIDFFNASIRVKDVPSSPAPTTFSAPNFEPKTFEDPAQEEIRFGTRLAERRSSSTAREGRRSSWGMGGKKSRRSNI